MPLEIGPVLDHRQSEVFHPPAGGAGAVVSGPLPAKLNATTSFKPDAPVERLPRRGF